MTNEKEQEQYLSFFLAGEEYALGILQVREIIEYSVVTKMPSMPTSVRGVINLRGSVVPVIDLALRFGMPATQITKWTCIVIVEAELDGERKRVGLLADAVSQVIDLAAADIEPPPSFGTHVRADFLDGMGKVGSKFVLILDLERTVSVESLLPPKMSAAAVSVQAQQP